MSSCCGEARSRSQKPGARALSLPCLLALQLGGSFQFSGCQFLELKLRHIQLQQ